MFNSRYPTSAGFFLNVSVRHNYLFRAFLRSTFNSKSPG
jgi:hypothetical protein